VDRAEDAWERLDWLWTGFFAATLALGAVVAAPVVAAGVAGLGAAGGALAGGVFAVAEYVVRQMTAPAPLRRPALIGDFRIPQGGLLAIGTVDFDPLDEAHHSTRVVRA
jgi:hypothetical protein